MGRYGDEAVPPEVDPSDVEPVDPADVEPVEPLDAEGSAVLDGWGAVALDVGALDDVDGALEVGVDDGVGDAVVAVAGAAVWAAV